MKNEKSLKVFNKMSVPQAVMKNAIPIFYGRKARQQKRWSGR